MKRKILLCLSLLGSLVSFGSARAESTRPEKGKSPLLVESTASEAQDPPLGFVWDNGSSSKGVTFFGATFEDKSTAPSIVRLSPNKPTDIHRLGPVDPLNEFKIKVIHCGAYTGKKYVGYMTILYTYEIRPARFVEIDTQTGAVKVLRSYDHTSQEYKDWPVIYDMTYDHKNNKCWGIARSNREDKKAYSTVYSINTETGAYTKQQDLEFYVWAAASDYDGNLNVIVARPNSKGEYVASEFLKLDASNGFKEIAGTRHEIKRNGFAIVPYYTHTAEVDHTTGDFYWLGADKSGFQYVYKINPDTGEHKSYGSVGYGDVITGLYIPYETAKDRKAPARVQGLQATYKKGDHAKAVLAWRNPTTTWDRKPLSSITKITIARDKRDNVVGEITSSTKVGDKMEWTDPNSTSGVHTYYVTAENAQGKGVIDSIRCYTGVDVPGVVQNLSAQKQGADIEISWSAPAKGAHDGFIKPEEVTYTITRMPDKKVVATNLKTTTYKDSRLGFVMAYSYIVTPKNTIGNGVPLETEKIVAGEAYKVPYSTDFKTYRDGESWSDLDANEDGKRFVYSGGGAPVFERMALDPAGYQRKSDDWLFSPKLSLLRGRYEIITKIQLEVANTIHDFSINIGKGTNPQAQKQLKKFEYYTMSLAQDIRTEVVVADIEEDGVYNVGIHCTSIGSADVRDLFCVQGVTVKRLYEKDLAVKDFELSEIINETQNKVVVRILNEGTEPQSAYKVRLLEMNGDQATVVAELTEVPTVKSKETVDCIVKYTPKGKSGKMRIAAEVVLSGDGERSNNRSQTLDVKVLKSGTMPWSHLITDDVIARETTMPISFMRHYSTGQTIYPAEELGFNNDATISRLAYDYVGGVAVNTPTPVKIYLGNVDNPDLAGLSPQEACVDPATMTLVYDGHITIKNGVGRLEFDFQTPFQYKKGKHLCVQVWKEARTSDNIFPAQYAIFGKGSGVLRSVRYMDNKSRLNPAAPTLRSVLLLEWVPQLRLAAQVEGEPGSVQEVLVASPISYDAVRSTLLLGGFNARAVRVYDLAGRLVLDKAVATGSDEVDLGSLAQGHYVAVVHGTDGTIARVKLHVNQ